MSDIEDQGSFRASDASMLERMARAMVAAEQDQWETPAAQWDAESLERHGLMALARAALEAIREPSVEVAEAGMIAGGFTGYADVAFTAMIDAILQGKA